MRETPRDRVPGRALRAALPAPRIRLGNPAFEHRPVGLEVLADDSKSELIEAAEGREIRFGEGSGGHVEVFQRGS